VIDAALLQAGEELLERPRGVARAALGRDAVARVARAIGEVQIADVGEADDRGPLPTGPGC
jgi:hypothetical protein